VASRLRAALWSPEWWNPLVPLALLSGLAFAIPPLEARAVLPLQCILAHARGTVLEVMLPCAHLLTATADARVPLAALTIAAAMWLSQHRRPRVALTVAVTLVVGLVAGSLLGCRRSFGPYSLYSNPAAWRCIGEAVRPRR